MQKIIQFLLILLLISFPTGELLRIKIYQNVNIVPQDIIVLTLFLFVIFKFIKDRIKPKFENFFIFQVAFIAVGVISLVVNCYLNPEYNFFVSLMYAVRYLMYLSIFFYPVLVGDKFNVKNLLFMSGGVIVLIGIPQFFFYNDLRNLLYLGWDDHLYRLFTTFLDPNFAGLFFVLYLGFLIMRIEKKGIFNAKVEVLFSLLTFVSIYLTYSRSALVALFIFIISIFVLYKKLKPLLIVIPILLFLIITFSDFGTEGLNPLRTASSRNRISSINSTITIIKDNSFFGVGFNSFRYALLKYGLRTKEGVKVSNADSGTDNSFLFVLATSGFTGFSLFILSYYKLLKNLYKKKTFANNICISIIISLFAGGMFINILFYMPIILFLFLMLSFIKLSSEK